MFVEPRCATPIIATTDAAERTQSDDAAPSPGDSEGRRLTAPPSVRAVVASDGYCVLLGKLGSHHANAELLIAAEKHGARFATLPDGTIVASFPRGVAISEQIDKAAHLALELRAHLRDASLVLFAEAAQQASVTSDAISRGLALLGEAQPPDVRLNATAASLLGPPHEVRRAPEGGWLCVAGHLPPVSMAPPSDPRGATQRMAPVSVPPSQSTLVSASAPPSGPAETLVSRPPPPLSTPPSMPSHPPAAVARGGTHVIHDPPPAAPAPARGGWLRSCVAIAGIVALFVVAGFFALVARGSDDDDGRAREEKRDDDDDKRDDKRDEKSRTRELVQGWKPGAGSPFASVDTCPAALCFVFDAEAPKRLDVIDTLAIAKKAAEELKSPLRFVRLDAERSQGGTVDLTKGHKVTYFFGSSTGSAYAVVAHNSIHIDTQGSVLGDEQSAQPTCTPRRAWKAAVAAGLHDDQEALMRLRDGEWQLEQFRSKVDVALDAESCRVIRK